MDAVTLAILKGRLEQIADEMDATLFRSAFNPIIAEAHDASHGIYDSATGETLVQGKSGLPIFVGVMAFAVKAVIDKVKKDGGLQEGDVFIFNDPYDGGTHLSDFRLVKPVFRRGKFFVFLPLWVTGMMWAVMFQVIIILRQPKAFKKVCLYRR